MCRQFCSRDVDLVEGAAHTDLRVGERDRERRIWRERGRERRGRR
jgi:hypothetical protein